MTAESAVKEDRLARAGTNWAEEKKEAAGQTRYRSVTRVTYLKLYTSPEIEYHN